MTERVEGLMSYVKSGLDNNLSEMLKGQTVDNAEDENYLSYWTKKIIKLMERRDKTFYKKHPTEIHSLKIDLMELWDGYKKSEANEVLRRISKLKHAETAWITESIVLIEWNTENKTEDKGEIKTLEIKHETDLRGNIKGNSLVVWFKDGATAKFKHISSFLDDFGRIIFDYVSMSTGERKRAVFLQDNISGYSKTYEQYEVDEQIRIDANGSIEM